MCVCESLVNPFPEESLLIYGQSDNPLCLVGCVQVLVNCVLCTVCRVLGIVYCVLGIVYCVYCGKSFNSIDSQHLVVM